MIYAFCRGVVKILVILLYRHKVYGKAHIRPGGGLIASNHASFLDPQLIGISCPEPIHFLARDTLFRFAPFGWLIRKLNTHPVSRGKGNLNTLKSAMEIVQSGKKVVIFPEGRRSPDGELQKGQLGVGMLVQRTRCLVFPVYVHGAYAIWSKEQKLPKLWGKTACVFGSPIEYQTIESQDRKEAQAEVVQKLMESITALKEWYLAGAKGTPP